MPTGGRRTRRADAGGRRGVLLAGPRRSGRVGRCSAPGGAGQSDPDGGRHGGDGADPPGRRSRRAGVAIVARDRGAGSTHPDGGRRSERTHGGHPASRRGQPLHRGDVPRLRAGPNPRVADGPRCIPQAGRLRRAAARHLPRPEQRLLLLDEPERRPGRRPRVRERRDERGLGRDLERRDPALGSGLERGVRDPLQEPELPAGRHGLGLQHQSQHPAEVRGGPLGGRPFRRAVCPGLGGGRDHGHGRPRAGPEPGYPAVRRGALESPCRQRRRQSAWQARPRSVLQRDAQPEVDGHLQHRLRRGGSRRAPDQPDPFLDLLSREAVVLPAGCRRLQLRHDRGRPAGRHSRYGGGDLPVLQPPDRSAGRAGSAARLRGQADRQGGPNRGWRPQRGRAQHLLRRRAEPVRRARTAELLAAVVRRRPRHQRQSRPFR